MVPAVPVQYHLLEEVEEELVVILLLEVLEELLREHIQQHLLLVLVQHLQQVVLVVVLVVVQQLEDILDQEEVVVRHRAIPERVVRRAVAVTVASLLFVLAMALLLGLGTGTGASTTDQGTPISFLETLFTCVSAFGTVGLDLGVTSQLNRWGQLVLMVGMFVGRVGILLLLSALYGSRPQNRVGFPREEIYL